MSTTTITKVVEITFQSLLIVQTAAAFMSAFILALHAHMPLVVHSCHFTWVDQVAIEGIEVAIKPAKVF